MRIKKITKLKSGKYKVELEDKTKITTYDSVLIENNILYKKELDSSTYDKMVQETLDYAIYSKVLKYCSICYRSMKQVQNYMNKMEIPVGEQDKIIKKLKKNNILNEEKFVESFISDQIRFTNDGPNKIKKQLLEHNIPIECIDQYLRKYDDSILEEKLEKLIAKKQKNQRYSKMVGKQKLLSYLLNLGYEKDMIQKKLSNVTMDSQESLERDYKKIKKKLSLKYQGSELEYQIKVRLYRKGYSKEEIGELEKEA